MVIRKQSDLEDVSHKPCEGARQTGRKLETCTLAKMYKLGLRPA